MAEIEKYTVPNNAVLKHTLNKPILIGTEEVSEIFIREPTLRDMNDAGIPIIINSDGNVLFDAVAAPKMLSRLSNVPMFALDRITAADAMACFFAIRPFFLQAQMPTPIGSSTFN